VDARASIGTGSKAASFDKTFVSLPDQTLMGGGGKNGTGANLGCQAAGMNA
jgi:hypothetical protein